jgi:hypothetical protein
MKIDEVYQFFGSAKNATSAIGVSRGSFYKWIDKGFIPMKQQKRFELLTKGKLKSFASESDAEDHGIYLPIFRYYDKKHGMCEVESIHFRKGKRTKIIYVTPANRGEKFSVFNKQNLMQSFGILDCDGNLVYEGDILLLKNKEKFVFKSVEFINKLKKLAKFKIIGNIFE